jgi:ssDNA-binding replication factor A large subunit
MIQDISTKSGKTEKEIKNLIEAKIKKFSGLLTENGAVFMVQKELGLKQDAGFETKISDLEEGMKGIEISGEIKAVFPAKEFEKNGKKGKLMSFIMGDESGEVRATLWNDQVDKYEITTGSEIKIINCVASKYNDKKQISLGINGTIEFTNKKEVQFDTLSALSGGMNNINVIGRLLRKYPCKEFESGERKGKLCSFQFGDGTALLRATAWNEKADEIEKYSEGDALEINNAYTKNGLYGIELHLGYSAQTKVSEKKMPSTIEMLKESIVEKKINSLMDNENVIINGKISDILIGKLFFTVCEKCGKKVSGEGKVICEVCGEVKGEKKAVVKVNLEDDTSSINSTLFGKNALKCFQMTQEKFNGELENKSAEKIIEELKEKIVGKKVKLFGYQKTNSFSQENEFSVKEIL